MQSLSPSAPGDTLPCRIPKKKFLHEMRLSTDAKSSGSDVSSPTDGLSPQEQLSDCSPLFSARIADNIIGSPDSNFLDKIQDMVSRGSGLEEAQAGKTSTAFNFDFVNINEAASARPRGANPGWSDKFVDLDFYNRTKDSRENGAHGEKFSKLASFDEFGKDFRQQSELCKLEQFADVCSSQTSTSKQRNTFQRRGECQPEDLTVSKPCDYTTAPLLPAGPHWPNSGPPYYCDMPPNPPQYIGGGGGGGMLNGRELQFDMASSKACVSPPYTQTSQHVMPQGADFQPYLNMDPAPPRTFAQQSSCSPGTPPGLHYPSSSHTVTSPGGTTWQAMTSQFSPNRQVSSTTPGGGSRQLFSGSTCGGKMKPEKDGMTSTITTSGRNKGSGRANEPKFECQVCGDVAAGFHCGAYVCEACKKFYLRCLKHGNSMNYTCPKDQRCIITKETRSHCQFCRLQKCLQLQMYKPGRDDGKQLKVDFKSIPCKVCTAPSSGFHFGAITCEGCKGFFRRMIKEQQHRKFVCNSNGNCPVNASNRTACKRCRYIKCLQVGMTLEGTRLGRQSNSVKRTTLIQYRLPDAAPVSRNGALADGATDEPVIKKEIVDLEGDTTCIPTRTISSSNDDLMMLTSTGEVAPSAGEITYLSPQHDSMDDDIIRGICDATDNLMFRGQTDCISSAVISTLNSLLPPSSKQFDNLFSGSSVLPPGGIVSSSDALLPPVGKINSCGIDGVVTVPDAVYTTIGMSGAADVTGGCSAPLYGGATCGIPNIRQPGMPILIKENISSIPRPLPDFTPPLERPRDMQGGPPTLSKAENASYTDAASSVQMSPQMLLSPDLINDREKLAEQLVLSYRELEAIMIRSPEQEACTRSEDDLASIWNIAAQAFFHHVKCLLKFIKKVPGFRQLPMADQIKLVQEAAYPLSLLYHAQFYNLDTGEYHWFNNTNEERDFVLGYFPRFIKLGQHFQHSGYLCKLLQLTEVEYAFLSVIVLLEPDTYNLEAPDQVSSLREQLLDAFFDYSYDNLGVESNRPGTLLLRVGELRRACVEHMEIAICSQKDNPEVDFSELWKEMFLNMAGEGFKPRGVCKKRLQMDLAALGQVAGAQTIDALQGGPAAFMQACQSTDMGLCQGVDVGPCQGPVMGPCRGPDVGPCVDKSLLPRDPNT